MGVLFAVISGLMNGTFTLPMRFLGLWAWENVWALFILVSCILMPAAVALLTVPDLPQVLAGAPARAVLVAMATGFVWGFGAIMFGQGVSAIGIAIGNTLVLAISGSIGSLLPILILAPERLFQSQGRAIVLGTSVGLVGIALCGYAGRLRERRQKQDQGSIRGQMVGKARPFFIGLLLCAGAGLLSAVFNIGYSAAQPIVQSATHVGYSPFAGSNVIWLLMLGSGAVANLGFCGYLFRKNSSWLMYRRAGSPLLFGLSILMGLLWGGSIFVYGAAAPRLGRLGPAIGWPVSLIVGLITANLCGLLAGEWKGSGRAARLWMGAGILVLVVAICALGWSGTLAG
jgi:L-rhamnose-H+ transport protein